MERFIQGSFVVEGEAQERDGVLHFEDPRITSGRSVPQLRSLSIDIETDGLEGRIFSIAAVGETSERVFISRVEGANYESLEASNSVHEDEISTLEAFFDWVEACDPDLLLGWNVIEFDLRFLMERCRRHHIKFRLARAQENAEILSPRSRAMPYTALIPGRVVLDGIATLRSATIHFESYALNDVAVEILGRQKKIEKSADAVVEIRRMAHEDPAALCQYNLEDCRLVRDIFQKAKLVEFAVERQGLTGLALDRQGGSVAAFDQLYLPRLHRAGYVAPSVGDRTTTDRSPGGYVMDSKPGLYENVLVLDFKSLYPSIIRTFCIDPLGLALAGEDSIEGFDGARFSRDGHILPSIIEKLWRARDAAKKGKNSSLSQAIKIMMNSFYGVLGTPGCRFFDPRLVSSITKRGHEILGETRDILESDGHQVIYGDTDSVFVLLGPGLSASACAETGAALALRLTQHFDDALLQNMRLDSHLELEFEAHYHKFLMPKMRGSEVGTKKRYAGLRCDASGRMYLVFKGLEAVRTDWTPLARHFQRELFSRIFNDLPYLPYVQTLAREVKLGLHDTDLVYRKRLRRGIDEYENNVPPHVQAARLLENPGRFVHYVITSRGPQPIGRVSAPLDYNHYLQRQIAPAADSLLQFLGTSFDQIAGSQMNLF